MLSDFADPKLTRLEKLSFAGVDGLVGGLEGPDPEGEGEGLNMGKDVGADTCLYCLVGGFGLDDQSRPERSSIVRPRAYK